MPEDTTVAGIPPKPGLSEDIGDSMDAFVAAKNGAPAPVAAPVEAAPPKPAERPPEAPIRAQTEKEIDLSGAIEEASAPKPKAAEEPKPTELEKSFETGPKALREEYARVKTEAKTLRAELEAERAKPKSQQDPVEIKTLRDQIAAFDETRKKLESERDEHAKALAKVSFRDSPEFKEKYVDPWQKAQNAALEELGQFTKENEDGKQVPVEWSDIKPLLSMSIPDATAKAKELFGDYYMQAMEHRRVIQRHQKEYFTALDNSEALRKESEANQSVKLASAQRTFDSEVARLATEYPDLYATAKDNPRETEQFEKGMALADSILLGKGHYNEATAPKAVALVRQRAAMMPVLAIRVRGLMSENEALKAEVAKLKGGAPGGGVAGALPQEASTDELGDSMDRFRARARTY